MIKVMAGDCRDVMATMAAGTFDACVCDPPYGLEFMGKEWDAPWKHGFTDISFRSGMKMPVSSSRNPCCRVCRKHKRGTKRCVCESPDFDETPASNNKLFQEWCETWATEVYRVLKPGAYLIAFSGTRTYHRMVCAIEDAGFIIHPMLGWLFGCLSDDTMIAAKDGEKRWDQLTVGDLVLCYDAATGGYSFEAVEEIVSYDIDDTCYRIQSDKTDQLVSRNHRCIVERGGKETFQYAETLERQEAVPVLASLPELRKAILSAERGSLPQGDDVLGYMRQRSNQQGATRASSLQSTAILWKGANCLRPLWQRILGSTIPGQTEQGNVLHAQVSRFGEHSTPPSIIREAVRLVAGNMDRACRAYDRAKQSIVERWRDISEAARQLCRGSLCPLPASVPINGAQGRLRDGAQAGYGEDHRSMPHPLRDGPPHQPQPTKQRVGQSDAVRDKPRPQAIRAWPGHHATVATVTPERYRGIVWCVRVRTGAFVAVRNGQAFVTGNSGFPKAANASKAIDKHLGKVREVVGPRANLHSRGKHQMDEGWKRPWMDDPEAVQRGMMETAPGGPEAAQWEGWAYGLQSLKPALEPICLAQKPMEGTGAQNLLKHGVGAVNIDACRVPLMGPDDEAESKGKNQHAAFGNGARENVIYGADGRDRENYNPPARWPANVLHDGSDEVLDAFAAFGESKSTNQPRRNGDFKSVAKGNERAHTTFGHSDAGTAARFFYSAKADAADRADSKHPTIKPVDLIRWLVQLVTPPGGRVLDPFAGSGTTGEAAMLLGFDATLIEADTQHVKDIEHRIKRWSGLDMPLFGAGK